MLEKARKFLAALLAVFVARRIDEFAGGVVLGLLAATSGEWFFDKPAKPEE